MKRLDYSIDTVDHGIARLQEMQGRTQGGGVSGGSGEPPLFQINWGAKRALQHTGVFNRDLVLNI